MLVSTLETVPGKRIVRVIGLVKGNTIRARHVGHDFMAGLKNLVGGEIDDYTKMIAESREQALDRMIAQARTNPEGQAALKAGAFSGLIPLRAGCKMEVMQCKRPVTKVHGSSAARH